MATKKCPQCAEEIQDEAKKCRYCGYDFVNETGPGLSAARVLDTAIQSYITKGWVLISKTEKVAQLRKPKQFNWLWFLFWVVISFIIIGGLGLLYLIYYWVKKDQIVSLSIGDAGELLINGQQEAVSSQSVTTIPTRPMTPEEQAKVKKSNQKVLLILAAIVVMLILASVICQNSNSNVPVPAVSLSILALLV